MLFGRREPAGWRETLRIAVWPRRSWARSAKYVVKRILRLTASPHAIAAGVAAGVFASFTPFLGFHFMIAFFVAYAIAGNLLAAGLGTFVGNPFTFPFIWASTYATGRFILSGASTPLVAEDAPHDELGKIASSDVISIGPSGLFHKIAAIWEPVVKPMAVGAIPLGIMAGIVAYLITRTIAIGFRSARKKQLAIRKKKLGAINPGPVEVQDSKHAEEPPVPQKAAGSGSLVK